MHRVTRYILLVLLVHISFLCYAQDEEYVPDTSSSIVEPPVMMEGSSSFSEMAQQQPAEIKNVPG